MATIEIPEMPHNEIEVYIGSRMETVYYSYDTPDRGDHLILRDGDMVRVVQRIWDVDKQDWVQLITERMED